MNDIDIGSKIQEFRKIKGYSIRELAKAAGVTASLLSQLERNLANPSINTMKAIAAALEVPLFNFFVEQKTQGPLVVRADKRKKLSFPQSGELAYELLTPDTNGAIEFLLMKLPPGASSSDRPMGHEGEEVSYVIAGEIVLHVDDDVIILEKGDSVRIPPHARHVWENRSKKNAEVIFAITPPTF